MLMRHLDSQERRKYADAIPNLNFLKNPPEYSSAMTQNKLSVNELNEIGGNWG